MSMKSLPKVFCLLALLALGGTTGRSESFAIQSFDGTGRIVFGAVAGATNYQVKTAPTPTGTWSVALGSVEPTAANAVTASVSMVPATAFYRVEAFTNVPSATVEGMVAVAGGSNIGTDPDFGAYSLSVEAFSMDATEVTKAHWDEVYTWAIAHGYSFDNAGSGKSANHPVHTVNWYDVVKWCNARSQMEGLPAVYTVGGAVYKTGQSDNVVQTSAAGYRLPTDEEWEYAARGGFSSRRFPWGDEIQHSLANYYSSSSYSYDTSPTRGYHPDYDNDPMPYTSPAGSFAANGYGLYDMSGNVWEWCFDWYWEDEDRVMRGGSWDLNIGYDCRVGTRFSNYPDSTSNEVGFRTVLSPEQ